MFIIPKKSFWFALSIVVLLVSSCTKPVQTSDNYLQSDLRLNSSLTTPENDQNLWLTEVISQHLKNSNSAQANEYKTVTDSQPIIIIIPGALSIRTGEELSLKIHRGGTLDNPLSIDLTADSSNFVESVLIPAGQRQSETILIAANTFASSSLVTFSVTAEGYTQDEESIYVF